MALGLLALEGAIVALILYTLYGAIYRLCLSPVAEFLGRKLAALTFWYEFYYDIIKCGSYVYEIKKMYEEHGQRPSPPEKVFDPPKTDLAFGKRFNHSDQPLRASHY